MNVLIRRITTIITDRNVLTYFTGEMLASSCFRRKVSVILHKKGSLQLPHILVLMAYISVYERSLADQLIRDGLNQFQILAGLRGLIYLTVYKTKIIIKKKYFSL